MNNIVTRRDEPDFNVTLTIRLSTRVGFARSGQGDEFYPGDDDIISKADAIDNAIGSLPQSFLDDLADGFGGEFMSAMPIDGEATLVEYD